MLDVTPPPAPFQGVAVDVADAEAVEQAVASVVSHTGRLDAVVTCAGLDHPGPIDQVAWPDWERVVAVNLLGTAAVVRAALPELRHRRGRIVTVASTLGHRAVGDATACCASKFGVVGFTRALTAELAGDIGVTLVTPGVWIPRSSTTGPSSTGPAPKLAWPIRPTWPTPCSTRSPAIREPRCGSS